MTSMVVGYKLIDTSGVVHKEYGGTWGYHPSVPNPIFLPNGDHIHAPSLNTEYSGYTLVEWIMDEPPPPVPDVISPRQCRLMLNQMGRLKEVEAMIAQSTDDVKITWEYALEFRRNDPILTAFAASLTPPLTDEEIDQFFIAAAQL